MRTNRLSPVRSLVATTSRSQRARGKASQLPRTGAALRDFASSKATDCLHHEHMRFAHLKRSGSGAAQKRRKPQTFQPVSSSPMNALTSPRPRNHDCGLTLRSSGLAPAGRLWPSFHSGPKPSCRRQPLTLNVRHHSSASSSPSIGRSSSRRYFCRSHELHVRVQGAANQRRTL